MSKIKVTCICPERTIHLVYGELRPGQELEIEEEDFGKEIFEKIKNREGGRARERESLKVLPLTPNA